MNIEEAREYCLSLKNVTECFPFDDVSLVFKVEGKMFLLLPLDAVEPCVSLKCSTDYVEDLRDDIRQWKVLGILTRNTGTPSTLTGICRTRDQALVHHSYREAVAKITEENKRSLRK